MTSTFHEEIWEAFDFSAVTDVLMSENERFYHEKALYMAAFGAWIAAPNDEELRKKAISRAILQVCIAVEQAGYKTSRTMHASALLLTEAYGRIGFKDITTFYDSAYHSIGGLKTVARDYACDNIAELFTEKTRMIASVADVIGIYHWHGVNFRKDKNYHRPSLLKASELVSVLLPSELRSKKSTSDRNVRKAFSDYRDAAVLIYVARSISARPFENLLCAIQRGAFVWDRYGDKISLLLRRAAYVQKRLLPLLYQNEGIGKYIDLPDLDYAPFKAPAFDETQTATIRQKFGRYAPVRGRAPK